MRAFYAVVNDAEERRFYMTPLRELYSGFGSRDAFNGCNVHAGRIFGQACDKFLSVETISRMK